MPLDQRELLAEQIRQSRIADRFDANTFLRRWFRERGNVYLFLFRKNVSVTNLQYVELLSLVREYITDAEDNQPSKPLLFYNHSKLNDAIQEIADIFSGVKDSFVGFSDVIANRYSDLFFHAAVVEPLYTSCYVALPFHLKIDLRRVCGESGYIHYCGRLIFARSFQEAKKDDLFSNLKDHLRRFPAKEDGQKVRFIPYTHEDFTPSDYKRLFMRDALADGLDGVKLRIGKLNMDGVELVQVLRDLKITFSDHVELLRRGEKSSSAKTDDRRTIWLITDNGVDPLNSGRKGTEQHYICYDQEYFNANPFFLFEEEKPGWKSHTTTPHTLVAAMINATKPWGKRLIVVVDPFVSTGTTYFEALRHARAQFAGSDIDPMSAVVIHDNAKFFGLDTKELNKLLSELECIRKFMDEEYTAPKIRLSELDSILKERKEDGCTAVIEKFRDVVKAEGLWADQELVKNLDEVPQEVINELQTFALTPRIIFYIMLRARNRYFLSIGWGSTEGASAFKTSLFRMLEIIKEYKGWVEATERLRSDPVDVEKEGHLIEFSGKYSKSVGIHPGILVAEADKIGLTGQPVFEKKEATALEPRSCDIIVADPPYGFNTKEGVESLSQLYVEMIPVFLRALRHGGHLLICLPMRSFTGKSIPIFVRSEFVVSQILASVSDEKRRLVRVPKMHPHPNELFSLPYYWFAGEALGRHIIHFLVEDEK